MEKLTCPIQKRGRGGVGGVVLCVYMSSEEKTGLINLKCFCNARIVALDQFLY